MKKWAAGLAVAGALWMIFVLTTGSLSFAKISNYPGVFTARWVQYKGIAPSQAIVWAFNLWLLFTSAVEWVVVGLSLRAGLHVSVQCHRCRFSRQS
jgi:hypothetical protein